ncbi:reverse transcriptase [Elysia marginata]|uniref:Reverse transcriptase n=1 Tax=Elysia marginata TaxID=1093978 RepID=A0AAV4G9I5_9GAST|nr:reverse transcriptase [Elysia marginata]
MENKGCKLPHQFEPGKGQHECEILPGKRLEATEMAYLWDSCEKYPGHAQYISIKDFLNHYVPRYHIDKDDVALKAWIDLTVRLRMRWTSLDRPDNDPLSHYRGTDAARIGTGFIRGAVGPVDNEPCPCEECVGKVTRNYWVFYVRTAHHVVLNTEEAEHTKVDLFYDSDESRQQGGSMRTVQAMKVFETKGDRDCCELLCVTHDEGLGQRLFATSCRLVQSKLNPVRSSDFLELIPAAANAEEDFIPTFIVSHPHGQPKKITVGVAKYGHNEYNNVEYSAPTCPGSSGASVFLLNSNTTEMSSLRYVAPVHCGSYTTNRQLSVLKRYTPLTRREPPVKKTVFAWTADAWETLRAWLECTDWSVFVNSTQDMSELADTVCCYINFCIETAIPTKTIKVISNNKPWFTKDIKQILNRKKIAFQNKRDYDIKSIHKEVRATIRQGKESYKRKIEKYFKNNHMRKVWQGMNLMVGCKGKKGNNCVEGDEGYANDLNKFYARFDCHDFVQEREECKSALLESLLHDRERIVIDESEVRKAMLALKPNKAPVLLIQYNLTSFVTKCHK